MKETLACDGCDLALADVGIVSTVLGPMLLCQTCQLRYIGLLDDLCRFHARHGRLPTESELDLVAVEAESAV